MVELKIGDIAPNFVGTTGDGKQISLSDYKGKKVALYFYPKDSTPGCTAQACSLESGKDELANNGYSIIGVSCDSEASHAKFAAKHNLSFALIADTEQQIVNDYGVWRLKKFMGREKMGIVRTTFIIDEQGIITNIISKVNTKDHANQILNQ